MPNTPQAIDVKLSLADDNTMSSLISELEKLRALMTGIKQGGGQQQLGGELQTGGMGASRPEDIDLGQAQAGGAGASTPPNVAPHGPWWRKAQGNLQDPIQMPRFGEFNIQDTLNMAANTIGRFGARMDTPEGRAGIGPSTAASTAIGSVAGTLGIAQNYSPYATHAAAQLGVPNMGPYQLQAQGQALGLQRATGGDVNLGPLGFQIPGSQYFGDAGRTMLHQTGQAIGVGMGTPGMSITQASSIQDAFNQFGWAQNQTTGDDMMDIVKGLSAKGTPLPEDSVLASLMDDMVRYGGATKSGAGDALQSLADGAEAANMSIDEFSTAAQEVATELNKSLTTQRGLQAVGDFSLATGMPPQMMSSLMQNQYFQANALGQYGYAPEQMGLLAENTAAFTDTAFDTINQMTNTYKGQFRPKTESISLPGMGVIGQRRVSARDQADPYIAEQLGIPLEQLRYMRNNEKHMRIHGALSESLTQFANKRQRVHNTYEDASGELTATGESKMAKLMGDMGPKKIGMTDIKNIMRQPGSGMKDLIPDLEGKTAQEQISMIRKELKSEKNKFGNDPNRPLLDLTPWAKRLVREQGKKPGKNKDSGDHSTDSSSPDPNLLDIPTFGGHSIGIPKPDLGGIGSHWGF